MMLFMIKSFRDKETEKIINRQFSSKLPQNIQHVARKKLITLDVATELNDLRLPPDNHTISKIVVLAAIVWLSVFSVSCTLSRNMIHKTTGQVPIVFTYTGQCETVCLSGNFNGWSSGTHCLKRNGDIWIIKILLSPGRYKYTFIIDGIRRISDPNAFLQEDDGFGMKNSVLIVE